ncbi:MAG: hypothetical protein ACREDS_02825 [Limisphaerales bacterium]
MYQHSNLPHARKMLRQVLILKVFGGVSRSRRDCGNLEADWIAGLTANVALPQSP